MSQASDDSAAPPGFAAPLSFTPAVAVAAADSAPPELTGTTRRLPELPWRPLVAGLLLVVLAIAAYGLVNPAQPSDTAVVRGVINDYEHALAAGDGVKACALLTPMAQAAMVKAARRVGYGGTCVAAAGIVSEQMRARATSAGPAGSTTVDEALSADDAPIIINAGGNRGVVHISGQSIVVAHVERGWLISRAAPHHTRP